MADNITGMEEVSKSLLELADEKRAKKIARDSAREAIKIVLKAAKTNAQRNDDPETSAHIAKNIVVRAGKIKTKGAVRVRVGVNGGTDFWSMHKKMNRRGPDGKYIRVDNPHYRAFSGQTPYWWFVELGTKYSMAVPFLRPALEQNVEQVEQAFGRKFIAEVEKSLK